MIETIISWSTHNRFFVWLGIVLIIIGGAYAVVTTPVDAIPDLSENQVIIYTEWMGRNPKIIEDQITYPLVSNLQGIPRIKSIRASSMFGMSFVFVIFKDQHFKVCIKVRHDRRHAKRQGQGNRQISVLHLDSPD